MFFKILSHNPYIIKPSPREESAIFLIINARGKVKYMPREEKYANQRRNQEGREIKQSRPRKEVGWVRVDERSSLPTIWYPAYDVYPVLPFLFFSAPYAYFFLSALSFSETEFYKFHLKLSINLLTLSWYLNKGTNFGGGRSHEKNDKANCRLALK